MTALVLILLLLALLVGGIGLLVKGLTWLLIIAVFLIVVGAIAGFAGRGTT
jgi:hypothetical protein